jgi:hypothetical protein
VKNPTRNRKPVYVMPSSLVINLNFLFANIAIAEATKPAAIDPRISIMKLSSTSKIVYQ